MRKTFNGLSIRFGISAAMLSASLILVQVLFFTLQKSQIEITKNLVQSILRQEVNVSNSFLMARAITDLQRLGLISCTRLVSQKTSQVLLDLSYEGNCTPNGLFLSGGTADFKISSLNGEVWDISFIAMSDPFFRLSLWLTRLLIVASASLGLSLLFRKIDRDRRKGEEKERENRLLQNTVKKQELQISEVSERAQKVESLATHAAQVAHDIKSPLSVISLLSSRIGSDSPEEAKLLQEAAKGIIKSAENLLANVRNRQHSQDGPKVSEQSPSSSTHHIPALIPAQSLLNLDSLCRRTLEMKRVEYKDSKVTVRLSMYSNLPDTNRQVIYDPHHLESIISNVLNNGIEAIDRDGFINMDCSLDEDFVSLEIRDSGKGIPKDILERLGKEGVSHGKTNGNGIGLLHAFQTIQSWNGQMEIQSDGQRGSTVKIRLPSFKGPDAP
ncbi:MAG: HAMP domain-containing histidine kinase [Bdellovibrionaceae bacterium]|nr:HAMP domain-containing histidine kinase [Pseudobdellovibrionaceae bacterium]